MSITKQQDQINIIHQPQAYCDVCGRGDHSAEICGTNPESFNF